MKKRNKKFLIGILIIISIAIIGFFISSKVINEKKIIDSTANMNVNGNKVNDVVNAITEIDYQSISSLKEEDNSKAYVVVNLDNKSLEDTIDSIIDIAKKSKIKITFIENDDIKDKNKPYFKMIEENGHTVLPNNIDIKEILSKNHIKIIDEDEKKDFKDLNNQDVAFFIDTDNDINNIDNRDKDRIFECIFNLKNDFYSFKALI
ncbi:MAG: hypothetical protein ACRCVJ_03240 [Clostridium sp.]|uniref:hypothetical protein n=1 Tax=Clostridium sp. TaxID=1506 RepID=UPI003F3E9334